MPRRNVNPRDAKRRRIHRTCPKGKTGSYPDREHAEADLAVIRKTSKRYSVPHRAYPCDLCTSWHLTGQLISAPPPPRRYS